MCGESEIPSYRDGVDDQVSEGARELGSLEYPAVGELELQLSTRVKLRHLGQVIVAPQAISRRVRLGALPDQNALLRSTYIHPIADSWASCNASVPPSAESTGKFGGG